MSGGSRIVLVRLFWLAQGWCRLGLRVWFAAGFGWFLGWFRVGPKWLEGGHMVD